MDAVTYPHAEVTLMLRESFACLKVNIKENRTETRDLFRRVRPQWAPLFLFLDSRGTELRRFTGFLPPADFLAELAMVDAFRLFHAGDFSRTVDAFAGVAERFPSAATAPEALFWKGAAAFRASRGDLATLASAWNELLEQHPETTWATRASVIADAPDYASLVPANHVQID